MLRCSTSDFPDPDQIGAGLPRRATNGPDGRRARRRSARPAVDGPAFAQRSAAAFMLARPASKSLPISLSMPTTVSITLVR